MGVQIKGNKKGGGSWSVAQAKARFSMVVQRAESDGPQIITRHGQNKAVVVSAEEWKRKTHRSGNLAEFLAAGLRGSGLKIHRSKRPMRGIDL